MGNNKMRTWRLRNWLSAQKNKPKHKKHRGIPYVRDEEDSVASRGTNSGADVCINGKNTVKWGDDGGTEPSAGEASTKLTTADLSLVSSITEGSNSEETLSTSSMDGPPSRLPVRVVELAPSCADQGSWNLGRRTRSLPVQSSSSRAHYFSDEAPLLPPILPPLTREFEKMRVRTPPYAPNVETVEEFSNAEFEVSEIRAARKAAELSHLRQEHQHGQYYYPPRRNERVAIHVLSASSPIDSDGSESDDDSSYTHDTSGDASSDNGSLCSGISNHHYGCNNDAPGTVGDVLSAPFVPNSTSFFSYWCHCGEQDEQDAEFDNDVVLIPAQGLQEVISDMEDDFDDDDANSETSALTIDLVSVASPKSSVVLDSFMANGCCMGGEDEVNYDGDNDNNDHHHHDISASNTLFSVQRLASPIYYKAKNNKQATALPSVIETSSTFDDSLVWSVYPDSDSVVDDNVEVINEDASQRSPRTLRRLAGKRRGQRRVKVLDLRGRTISTRKHERHDYVSLTEQLRYELFPRNEERSI